MMQTAIETLAVVSAFLSVYYSIYQNIWVWPTGLISGITYFILFSLLHLYGDAVLQLVFIATTVYGWLAWKKNFKQQHEIIISSTGWPGLIFLSVLSLLLIALLSLGLSYYTNDSLPFLDACITVLSIIAQLLLCYRKLENWYFWILTNIVSIEVYFLKGIEMTAVLYMVFFILACKGLYQWRIKMRMLYTSRKSATSIIL